MGDEHFSDPHERVGRHIFYYDPKKHQAASPQVVGGDPSEESQDGFPIKNVGNDAEERFPITTVGNDCVGDGCPMNNVGHDKNGWPASGSSPL